MCVFERKATSKISTLRLQQPGSTGTVLTQGKQLFNTKASLGLWQCLVLTAPQCTENV